MAVNVVGSALSALQNLIQKDDTQSSEIERAISAMNEAHRNILNDWEKISAKDADVRNFSLGCLKEYCDQNNVECQIVTPKDDELSFYTLRLMVGLKPDKTASANVKDFGIDFDITSENLDEEATFAVETASENVEGFGIDFDITSENLDEEATFAVETALENLEFSIGHLINFRYIVYDATFDKGSNTIIAWVIPAFYKREQE